MQKQKCTTAKKNEPAKCILCGNTHVVPLFTKNSEHGQPFTLAQCSSCGLNFINPQPSEKEISAYYKKDYFTKRTSRGYDNYFSPELKREIERVIQLNLADLKFFEFESRLSDKKRSLDIGCAAGYFVNFVRERGWDAHGIDIAHDCTDFAKKRLKLNVKNGNYLETKYAQKFNLITMWATIEHLHHPEDVLEKIHHDLASDGVLYLSTCRTGGLNFMKLFGSAWRYYNFPEHLFFFSKKTITLILAAHGFETTAYFTYGSGLGKSKSTLRRMADWAAKYLGMGDMMIISAKKKA